MTIYETSPGGSPSATNIFCWENWNAYTVYRKLPPEVSGKFIAFLCTILRSPGHSIHSPRIPIVLLKINTPLTKRGGGAGRKRGRRRKKIHKNLNHKSHCLRALYSRYTNHNKPTRNFQTSNSRFNPVNPINSQPTGFSLATIPHFSS